MNSWKKIIIKGIFTELYGFIKNCQNTTNFSLQMNDNIFDNSRRNAESISCVPEICCTNFSGFIVSASTSFILDSLREPILYRIMNLSAVNNLLGRIMLVKFFHCNF